MQSFAGVVKQHLDSSSPTGSTDPFFSNRTCSFRQIDPSHLHDEAVSRLHARHPWADRALISDIFVSVDRDEERVFEILVSMSKDNMERVSAVTDAECSLSLQESDGQKGQAWELEDAPVGSYAELSESAKKGYLLEWSKYVVAEPEWEEDDLYYRSRRDALKMSSDQVETKCRTRRCLGASSKHARGAHKAFMSGNYMKAKALSKQAKEERVEAEKLHAEAAKLILEARNVSASKDLFNLDLHGLHVNEAVAALQQRLQEMEIRIANPTVIQESCISPRRMQKLDVLQSSFLQGSVFNKELKVITGVGNHSQSGGSLPVAIRSFLMQNSYNFEELRPGLVAVHPKFHLSKEKYLIFNH